MKKLILPILVAVIALSSCSQALYRNSYDWIKVDRITAPLVRDSVTTNIEPKVSLNETQLTSDTTCIKASSVVPVVKTSVEPEVSLVQSNSTGNEQHIAEQKKTSWAQIAHEHKHQRKRKEGDDEKYRDGFWLWLITRIIGLALILGILYLLAGPSALLVGIVSILLFGLLGALAVALVFVGIVLAVWFIVDACVDARSDN